MLVQPFVLLIQILHPLLNHFQTAKLSLHLLVLQLALHFMKNLLLTLQCQTSLLFTYSR